MRDYSQKTKEAVGFWNYHSITERQLVIDTILLLNMLESPTYVKQSSLRKMLGVKEKSREERFQLRQQTQVVHLSPKALEGFLARFIGMANVIADVH